MNPPPIIVSFNIYTSICIKIIKKLLMTKSIETLGRCLASEIHAIFAQYRYSLSRQTLDLTPLLRNLGSKYNIVQ